MIKFFRKIRQNLLSEGKTRLYFKYAIGEIILVVIGILIALQINNWNEDRKTTEVEIEYLKRLRSDLANDTAYYHRRIKYADRVITDHKKAVKISHTEITSSLDFFESFKFLQFSSEALSIRDITYNEMHNGGQIDIIKNEKIKTQLLDFYRQVDLASKHFDEVNNTSIEYMNELFIQSKAFKHFWEYGRQDVSPWTNEMLDVSEDWQWINDPQSESFKLFQFSLGFYTMKQEMFKGYFLDFEEKSTILLKEIENELRSRNIKVSAPVIQSLLVQE